MNHMHSTNSR